MQENERIEKLENKFEELDAKVTRVLYYLEDDAFTRTDGLVSQLREVSKKLDGILIREKVYKAKSTVWGMVGAAIISGIVWFAKLIIAKVV